ncbi:hypothetical protein AVEN_133347-1 [Araneus ventricosus]|uniref:RNase H type-1 domain-containing protein n=1 Tax=Araneus ventricosus TaxID=182803 RepID=A0A4Y2DK24_ARAVE|nr:hypothetical protein AVEN_133347-1 [Araneus ventricosus]
MHRYCDVSGKVYSEVAYFRIIPRGKDAETVVVVFGAAKTRVNPVEPVTIPRIELCSAFLLARLSASNLDTLPIQNNGVYLWSDSQIVLSWMHMPPKNGNQFVLNRMARIFGSIGPVESHCRNL